MRTSTWVALMACAALVPAAVRAQTGTLSGTVVHAETDAPIPHANVVASGPDGQRGASTDARGRYRLSGLESGTYRIEVTAIGFVPTERRIQVRRGETRAAPFALETQAYELNEIVVRGEAERAVTPTTVQRLPAAKIAQQDPANVAEIGRLIPGAHVQTNSRGQTLLYLRDAGERQVVQFFDGALLNVPWDNRVDIGVLPAAMLESVTVSKGVPSIRYGTNVIGGAVNFRSRSLDAPGQLTEVQGALGTARARRFTLTHQGRNGALSYTGAFDYAYRDDFALPGGADVPFSQPSSTYRTNTGQRFASGFLRGAYQFDGGGALAVSLLHVDAEKGVAPEGHVDPVQQPGEVRYWRYPLWRKSMLIASGALPLGRGATLRGSAWLSRFEQAIFQYQSTAYEQLRETQRDDDLTAGLRVIWTQPFGPGTFGTALNALTTRHRQVDAAYRNGRPEPGPYSTYRQHLFNVGTEYDVPLTHRLDVRLGVSIDGSVSADIGPWAVADTLQLASGNVSTAASVAAGMTYQITQHLVWKASVGRKPRFPTMRERFGGALGKFLPNPDLRPVTAYLVETGLVWRGTWFSGEVTGFLNRTYDAIDQTTLPSGIDQRINLDGSRVYGVEFAGTVTPTDDLTIDGHVTWMRPRGFRDGTWQKLAEKPAWLGLLTTTYTLPFGATVMAQSEYTAGAYARCEAISAACTAEQLNSFVALPRALVFNARLGYKFFARESFLVGELFLRMNNVMDEVRLLQLGLPGAGREFETGVKVTF